MDTDKIQHVNNAINYKLRQRLDYRKIDNIKIIEGVLIDKQSEYYNSENAYDGRDLNCVKGWLINVNIEISGGKDEN